MAGLIPFNSGQLPAFLQGSSEANTDLTSNVGAGFPYLSIKGKSYTVIRGGESKLITRTVDDEEIPANSIAVVILKANKNFSKVWYAKQYVEGSDAKPDCFSNNGDAPDPQSEKPQSKSCAACPHNQWGSRVSEAGIKGKSCQDARRIAVATIDHLNDPMLIRIPPATLKPLAEYGNVLAKRGVPYNAVVTKIKFDPESATPKLLFEPVGFLSEDQYREAEEISKSDLVQDIIGSGIPLVIESPAVLDKPTKVVEMSPVKSEAEILQASEAAVEAKATKKAETKQKAAEKTVDVIETTSDLDALLAELDD